MSLLETILESMSSVNQVQRQFIVVVLMGLMCLLGKANFRNLSRYSDYHEKNYSRGFRRDFDWVEFNQLGLSQLNWSGQTLVATIDGSFISKSGKPTYGLDKFYHSSLSKTETSLEILSFLRWLYQGEQKPRGRHRRDDGKVNFKDLTRLELAEAREAIKLYTAVVNSVPFRQDFCIVYWVKHVGNRIPAALRFSTTLKSAAKDPYRFYRARFQIEFLFRDAKQFTRLNACQARCSQALLCHFNAAMTALNLIKWEDRQQVSDTQRHTISIATWKIPTAKVHLLERFSSGLKKLDFSSIKSRPVFQTLCHYAITV